MQIHYQFLLVLSAVICKASAGYSTSEFVHNYDPVPIIHNGVPVDTPEVQAAKAQHFEAYNRAAILAAKQPSDGQYYEKIPQSHRTIVNYNTGYNNYQQDTPEVQHAKALHYAALSKASYSNSYRYKRGLYDFEQQHIIPVIKNGVPEETIDVQLAKYQHQVAHAVAHERENGHGLSSSNNGLIIAHQAHSDGYYHIPIIGKDGVPVDTPEVQSARAQHLLAHYYAKSGQSYGHQQNGLYSSEHEGPVIGPNGVPYETAEVQLARAEHLAAHAKESASHNQWQLPEGYGYGSSHY